MLSQTEIRTLLFNKLGIEDREIQEIQGNAQGWDQYVWIATTSEAKYPKIVVKLPKNNKEFRIILEVLACRLFRELDIEINSNFLTLFLQSLF
ncbi:MAG: hypothetical protein ACTSRK_03435 [Promethearchaeota archaeon]